MPHLIECLELYLLLYLNGSPLYLYRGTLLRQGPGCTLVIPFTMRRGTCQRHTNKLMTSQGGAHSHCHTHTHSFLTRTRSTCFASLYHQHGSPETADLVFEWHHPVIWVPAPGPPYGSGSQHSSFLYSAFNLALIHWFQSLLGDRNTSPFCFAMIAK